jgi:hypothetical protein
MKKALTITFVLFIFYFSLIIADRILHHFELKGVIYYFAFSIGFIKESLSNLF